MTYDDKGREVLDTTPVEMPAGFKRPESIHEMVKRYVRSETFRQKMDEAGFDTEEEANDFDVDDEDDMVERFISRHELSAMAAEELREIAGQDEFRRVKEQLTEDYERHRMTGPVNGDRVKEKTDGTGKERPADGGKGAGSGGEVGAASGGEGRAAGRSGE